MKSNKQILLTLITSLMLFQMIVSAQAQTETVNTISLNVFPNDYSIILMIGDGMGFNHVELGRLVEVGEAKNLTLTALPVLYSVNTRNINDMTTDSAAGATAIATGVKTTNGRISKSVDGTDLETILEYALQLNKATGVITTTPIQHATPACFLSHVESRNDYRSITDQIIENANVNVLLGGGNETFTTADLLEMESNGYTFVQNRASLLAHTSGKLLGLFAESNIPDEEVRNYTLTPSLAEMTNKTLEILSQDADGFFMMVEGGRIDHAAHDNDKLGVALEMIEFNSAIKVAVKYVKEHSNTLLLVTADHETGGLTIVSNTLDDIVPNDGLTAEENRTLRMSRVEDVVVDWSTGGHTSSFVPLYCYGEAVNNLESGYLVDNTQIFGIMHDYFSGLDIVIDEFHLQTTINKVWFIAPAMIVSFGAIQIIGTLGYRKRMKQIKSN